MLLRNFWKLPSDAYKKPVCSWVFFHFAVITSNNKTMASNQSQEYDEQVLFLGECYPEESKDKLLALLCKYNGNIDQV
jgi:hypothetical protein